ncbi:MAG TPA: hypothetical protein VH210_14625 [Gaiellaceae bacterium]|nr:hypothetical protein [Gaiellaceae bacterium]
MRAPLVMLSVGLAAIAAASAAAPASPSTPLRMSCTAGMISFGGTQARVFCGSAKATVKIGGKTFSFKGGSCERTSKYLAINVGTVVLGNTTKKKPDYFGLDVGAYPGTTSKPASHDGSYTGGVLAVEFGGKSYLLRGDTAKITVSGGRTRGTFSADGLLGSSRAIGSFSC